LNLQGSIAQSALETEPMSASPVLFNSSQIQVAPLRDVRSKWLPVLFSIIFVCFTSTTFMGGSHTQVVLDAVWKAALGTWHWNATGPVNEYLRKAGHFIGYGIIGIFFRNAWSSTVRVVRNWIMPVSASLGVVSTFAVACLDEWHQRYLPGRVGSMRDALLDAAGALFLNLLVWAVRARRRKDTLNRIQAAL
jgi:VanZ family protein